MDAIPNGGVGIEPDQVGIPSWNPFVLSEFEGPDTETDFTLQGDLYRPAAAATPAPAVVIVHGLGGVRTVREHSYAAWLAEEGYVALVLDCFKSRGVDQHIEARRALAVTETMMLADAFGSLRFLAALPEVDPDRIHIMGFSYGGMISVLAAHEQLAQRFLPDGLRFAGHVSYYGCTVPRLEQPATTGAPVTIMVGGKDGNVSIERSQEIAADLRRGGSPVTLTIFPDAYHQWDSAETRRSFVQFNLAACRVRLGADGEVRDERSGIAIRGPLSRALVLAMWVSLKGYYMRRDDDTRRRSDEILLDSLARA